MAKWKLRGDYSFYDKTNNAIRNELNADKSVKKQVVIDDKVHKVDGQKHKLEEVKDDPTGSKPSDTVKSEPAKPTAEGKTGTQQPSKPGNK